MLSLALASRRSDACARSPSIAVDPPARAPWLLWIGASAGLALAVTSLAAPAALAPGQALPVGAVAVVDGVSISAADYRLALQTIRAGAKGPVAERDKQAAVRKLIDEELMLAHGLALDLVRADDSARKALLSAVFATARASSEAALPSEDELLRFYRELGAELARPGGLRVRQLLLRASAPADRARAEQAVLRLRAGEAFASVDAELGTAGEPQLPDRLLEVDELRRLIGPIALQRVLALEPGRVSEVLGSGRLLRVIQLVERRPSAIPAFDQVRDTVLRAYRRRAGDRAFAAALAALRDSAEIRVGALP